MNVGILIRSQSRPPGCLRTVTVRDIGSGLGVTHLEPGASFSLKLTGNRGAALVTRHPTYKEDTMLENSFESYTKRQYDSWVEFARDKQYGDDVQPVLVSGFDMTRDFAMVAYSYKDASLESDLTTTIPVSVPGSALFWGTWHARYPPHTNYGPLPPEQAIDTPTWQLAEVETISGASNQCVFIRYFTMGKGRLGLFSKVIRV